jgi:hypothetical protein
MPTSPVIVTSMQPRHHSDDDHFVLDRETQTLMKLDADLLRPIDCGSHRSGSRSADLAPRSMCLKERGNDR